jgi:hypothetical protein
MYNPYNSPYARQQYEQQLNQYGQMPPPQYGQMQQQPPPLAPPNILAVNSEEEARSYQPDLSGATQIFVNKGNTDFIYCKQFNTQTALVDFRVYKHHDTKMPDIKLEESSPDLISIVTPIINGFTDKLNSLQTEIKDIKEIITHGFKSGGNSKPFSSSKPANAVDNTAGARSGSGGQQS